MYVQPKILIQQANEAVSSASCNPKKLTALHTGIAAGANLLVALLTYLLGIGIGDTGGLSGIGTRATLETAQSILQIAVSAATPFWSMGFVALTLHFVRQYQATPRTLLTGFQHWAPVVRMLLLEALIYFGIVFGSVQIGSYLYTLTPFADELIQLVEQSGTVDVAALQELLLQQDQATLMRIFWSMTPFLLLPAILVAIPVSYRLRMAQFVLLEQPKMGALYAILFSSRMMKKNCLQLFKLDLHFWWFYALEILVQVLCYGDLILPLMGVELGMNGVLASFLFYALALVCQIGLYVWQKPQIITSYALFYDYLLPRQEETEAKTERETQS